MVEQMVRVVNKTGLHARPAKDLCKLAKTFPCKVTLVKGEAQADAKSIIKVLTLDLNMGDQVAVRCDGEREADALDAVTGYIAGLTE